MQWDVLALGSEHHTFHVHGHRWRERGRRATRGRSGRPRASGSAGARTRPGTWLYHCHVEQHMEHGMIGIYRVSRR